MLLLLLMLPAKECRAQNISFRALAPDAISVTKQGSIDLEFGYLLLDSDIIRTITINDTDRLVALAIDAPAHYDLTVDIELADIDRLLLDGNESGQWIPFALEFAYANPGYTTTETYLNALADAVEIPPGFNSVTFPLSKRASGLSPLPPTPEYEGYNMDAARQRAFLFFYGNVGPANAGNDVAVGAYSTLIDVIIDFTSYDD